MSKVYITSKSKTFKEGSDLYDIWQWFFKSIEKSNNPGLKIESKQKYKITITNLK